MFVVGQVHGDDMFLHTSTVYATIEEATKAAEKLAGSNNNYDEYHVFKAVSVSGRAIPSVTTKQL